MRNVVAFQSEFYLTLDQSANEMAQALGRTLARHLANELERKNFAPQAPQTDGYNWHFLCASEGQKLRIQISEKGNSEIVQWLIIVSPQTNFLTRWWQLKRSQNLRKLCAELDQILCGDSYINNVQWFSEVEWKRACK